jgi:outer membrane lipoprotein carrier protein
VIDNALDFRENNRFRVEGMVVTLVLAAIAGIAPADQSASELAAALQKKIDGIKDFSTDFTHVYQGGVLRKQITERGRLIVKKPGKMRWTYKAPEDKTFVSNGHRMYMYTPADNQVIVSPVPDEDQATTAVLFLTGKGNLTRDFTVSYAEGGTADTYILRLQPKLSQRDYDWLQLVVDRRTLQIRSLVAADKQGTRSTFKFSNLRENVGLADNKFEFTIPRGADVIYTGNSSR